MARKPLLAVWLVFPELYTIFQSCCCSIQGRYVGLSEQEYQTRVQVSQTRQSGRSWRMRFQYLAKFPPRVQFVHVVESYSTITMCRKRRRPEDFKITLKHDVKRLLIRKEITASKVQSRTVFRYTHYQYRGSCEAVYISTANSPSISWSPCHIWSSLSRFAAVFSISIRS